MKKMGAKAVVVALAGVLAVGGVVGGTIAWLTDVTKPVTNTFTVGNVDIMLEENGATLNEDETAYEQSFKMVPGTTIAKKPVVTVEKDSEACWLFVKIVETANFRNFLECDIDPAWNLLETNDSSAVIQGVYYIKVDGPITANIQYDVLENDQVAVQDGVTKAMMDGLTSPDVYPTLTFTAYAIQQSGFDTPKAAWDEVSNS